MSASGIKNFTIRQMDAAMISYSRTHPDNEIFFDGDRFALCTMKRNG